MAISSAHAYLAQAAVTFGCSLTFRSEEHNGFLQVHGANEAPNLRLERNGAPLLQFDASIFSLVREGFAGLVTEKEIRYNTVVCLVNNATRTTANVQLTDGTERGLRVIMQANTKSTALRITPKYKTNSSSEFVHHGDKVAFNIDDTDLFLRIAEREDESFELVAASEPTVFDLKRFDRGAHSTYCDMKQYVQAGRTLSIYHRVHDMFLSHSPVDADKKMLKKAIKRNTQWQVTDTAGDRHLADDVATIRDQAETILKHSNVFFSEAMTTGALEVVDPGAAGLWVIEAADPTVGGPLRIGEMYRLRHFASGAYLSVRDVQSSELDLQVTVIFPDEADMYQDTLFDVEAPAENDLGHVSTVQSVVRFRHVRTQKWIATLDTSGSVITPATIHDKGHNRDRLRLRHIPELVESELQLAVGHLRHFHGWIEYFEELQNMPRSLSSVISSKETRAVVVRTVESLLALLELVCRPQVTRVTGTGGSGSGGGQGGGQDQGGSSSSSSSASGGGGAGHQQGGGGGSGGSGGGHHQGGASGGQTTSQKSAATTANMAAHASAALEKGGLPDPIRQRRLHELGTEEILMRVALAPFQARGAGMSIPAAGGVISLADVGLKECAPIVTAVRLSFSLLKAIVKGSPQHCSAASRMVEMMMYLESHQLHVAPALLAILEFGGPMSYCTNLLQLNNSSPNAAYIDALTHFCKDEGSVDHVIELLKEHRKTLVRTSVEYGRLMFAHQTIGKQSADDDMLRGGGGGAPDDDRIDAVTFDVFITQEETGVIQYYVATMRLFLAMARHGGALGIEFARGQIAREEILIVLSTSFKDTRNQNISDIVRATYAELATTLYLAKDSARISKGLAPVIVDPSGTLRGTAVRAIGAGSVPTVDFPGGLMSSGLAGAAGGASGNAQGGVHEGTFLRQLKLSALEFVKEHPVQVIELTGRNQMMWNCISIWHVFVSIRTASVAELKEVIPLLLNVLDGATDVYSLVTQNTTWDRYTLSEDSLNVLKTKAEICSLLETFVGQLQDEFASIVNERLGGNKENAEVIISTASEQIQDLIECLNIPRLIHITLDLILYESPDLMTAATHLLTQLCRWKQSELSLVQEMHILPNGSEQVVQSALNICSVIKDCDPSDRHDHIIKLIDLFRGRVTQDDNSRQAAGKEGLKVVLLNALRSWKIHEKVLEVMPEDPADENLPIALTCIEFFTIFSKIPANAEDIAEHWPMLFTAMQKHADIRAPVLQLLRLIWAQGNRLTPVQHADIKFAVSLIDSIDSLEVLPTIAALLYHGIPSHQLQRDVLNILIDFEILKTNWWIRLHGQMSTNLTNVLELCAAGGNPYTNSIVTSRLPLVVVVRQLHSTGMSKISVKCTLVRFAAVAHFSESAASRTAAETTDVVLGELWWRLIRDDFMVRLDELPAALDVADSLKQYIVEVASLLTAFFENRFVLGEVLRFDAILKELRHVAATMQHVCSSLTHMRHLTPAERFSLYKLGKAVLNGVAQLKDHSVSSLSDCIHGIDEKALLETPTESLRPRLTGNFGGSPDRFAAAPSTTTPAAAGDHSSSSPAAAAPASDAILEFQMAEQRCDMCQQRLAEVIAVVERRAEEDTTMDTLVEVLASLEFYDANCWKQRVISRLMLAVQRQQFGADAVCVVLTAVRKCIESAQEAENATRDKIMQMQNMMELLGALPVCTRLFDAVNTEIIVESLKLGIATLLDGNARVQNHFLDYLLATEEKMFFAIKRTCERSSLELYYWRRSQRNTAQKAVDLHEKDMVFSYLKLMLRFVQLLCEGHNLGLQEYIREQHDNIRSINTLHCVIALMRTLLLGATQPVEEELIQCFELCTEVCQGPCANNQLALISAGCGVIINTTLSDPTISLDVKSSAVTTLLSLLEGCTDPQVGEVIERAVPIQTLEHLYRIPIEDESSDAVVYSVGIFLRILQDLFKAKYPRRALRIHEVLSTRADISGKTGIIQIEREEDLERVYFRIPDACLNIREESKRRLLWDVDRSSQASKLASFVELADDLILEMDLTEQHVVSFFEDLRVKFPEKLATFVPTTINPSVEYWIFLSTAVAAFHNMCFLLDIFDLWIVHTTLGLCQIVLSCCIIFIDWQVASNVYFHKYKKLKKQVKFDTHGGARGGMITDGGASGSSASAGGSSSTSAGGDAASAGSGGGATSSSGAAAAAASSTDPAAGGMAAGTARRGAESISVSPVRELILRVSRPRAIQSFLFLIAAIAGCLWSPYLLGLHLLWIIDLSPAFQNVVAAITLNAKTLGLTIVLGMLFIYFFSMVGYSMFPEDFDTDDDPLYRENCASLSNCFLFMLTTGLRQGGGVGDVMRPKSWKQPQFVARKIFDFAFFAFLIIVFLNILFGIIIDTFAELRDAKSRKEDDMMHKCFVCGIDSHIFDRHGEGFSWHIKFEHSMWQYLYFLHHLRVKDPANYTGQESYISRLLERKDFSFFPQRCLSLEGKIDRNSAGDDGSGGIGGGAGGVSEGAQPVVAAKKVGGGNGAVGVGVSVGVGGGGAFPGAAGGPFGGGFIDAATLQGQFDKLAQQLRKSMVIGYSGGSGGAAEPMSRRSPGATHRMIESSRFRSALDVATQTVGGDTVVSLQFQLQQAQQEIKKLAMEKKEMQDEMKGQVEELWKIKSAIQHNADNQNRIHALESDLANKHRECDLAFAERDAVLRQNAFLQKEADRLLIVQAQADVAQRMRGPTASAPSPLHALRDSMMQRSQLYDALQIPSTPDFASPIPRPSFSSASSVRGSAATNNNNSDSNTSVNATATAETPSSAAAANLSVSGSGVMMMSPAVGPMDGNENTPPPAVVPR